MWVGYQQSIGECEHRSMWSLKQVHMWACYHQSNDKCE